MSTKKEKCRCCDGECNHDACCGKIEENCATNCPCHQSESIEWEKEFDERFCGLYEYMKLRDFISQAITTAVAKRELEIAEEVEKKSFRGFAPYEQDYLIKKEDVLSTLKH